LPLLLEPLPALLPLLLGPLLLAAPVLAGALWMAVSWLGGGRAALAGTKPCPSWTAAKQRISPSTRAADLGSHEIRRIQIGSGPYRTGNGRNGVLGPLA